MRHSLKSSSLAALLLTALLAGCSKGAPPPEPPRPVLTMIVGEHAVDADPGYSGEIRSRYETPLAFRLPGKMAARLVDVGAQVKAGQVLARLDPADTASSAAAAGAQLALAEADAKRFRDLRGKNFVSQAALDSKETALTAARSQADLARNQSAYTVLKAEQDGVVAQVLAEAGQVVTAGQPVFRMARTDTLEVAISIPESRLAEVRGAKAASIALWADDKASYRGVLRELSLVADTVTRTYPARIAFEAKDTKALLGMTATARFAQPGQRNLLTVPLTAIFQQDGKQALWLVNADQTLTLRPVEVASYADRTASLSAGVKPGEQIVVAGVHKLTAGEKIKVAGQAAAK